ncbi:hepatitis A virus cellular receptor 1 isoform X2 [Salminus brasiliensis]|uniref:hepatitis A virus cellular receptor 1 isoform X2 n=1 Tax=Salminus brasiliensis TaxID=930266 RepID=UPI003B831645
MPQSFTMNLLNCLISSIWLLLNMTVTSSQAVIVKGFYGEDVILPCKYNWRYHGTCEICWMRGDIPASGCGAEIIATDGDKVTRKTSHKYTLNGDIQKGDVSLTIFNAGQNDSGKYGCRVHVPGWFNDEKNTVHLVLVEEPASTASPTENSSLSRITEITVTRGPLLSLSTIPANYTNSSLPVHNRKANDTTYNMLPGIVVSVLLLLLLGLLVVYLMWKQKKKMSPTFDTTQNSVIYSNLNSSEGLNNREVAVENVYQIDTENEYERWS